ncbi:MAG: UDP-N-acetylmuramoyl-tripeptide--D-alanyl-D-alanine ligase [Patescibacteria group bacterium]
MTAAPLTILQLFLKLLAKFTILRYKPGVVGVTGSVGKTSAKEAIRTVLSYDRRVRAPSKSFNNELGLPLTIIGDYTKTGGAFFWLAAMIRGIFRLIFQSRRYPEILVLEYGVDRPGDMKYLLGIARPHVGILTAVGEVPVHVEFFSGPEAVLREKSRLITQLPVTGFAILNADEPAILELRTQTRAHVITFGFSDRADLRISNLTNRFEGGRAGLSFKLSYGGSFVPVRLEDVVGRPQAIAAAIGAATGLIFGMNLVKIAEALSHYQAPAGRFRVLKGIKHTTLIDDTYNASPLSMCEALETLKSMRGKRKIAVLGDMLEIGKYTLQSHEAAGRLAASAVHVLITVGLRGKFIAEAAVKAGLSKRSVFTFTNVREAGLFLQEKLQEGDLALLKASQAVRLEKVVKEVMADPARAAELLVRQNQEWLAKPGLYDE